jgi:outer membrane biosynthesis protein TonB
MRADLHTMEKIDQYLQGKLSGSELNQFESELASNPELQNLVSNQQLFIQTVNRKALLAEIQAVAGLGGAPWYANPWVAVSSIAIVGGIIAATIYYTSNESENPENTIALTETTVQDSSLTETINYNEIAFDDSTLTIITNPNTKEKRKTTSSEKVNSENSGPVVCDEGVEAYADEKNHAVSIDNVVKNELQGDGSDVKNRNRKASYPKGSVSMNEFVDKYMRFPGTAKEKKLSGNVKVTFLVTESGARTEIESTCFAMRDQNDKPLTNTQFVFNQKIANLFEREAERIVRIMPEWIPATDSGGNPVLTTAEIYFNFSLHEGISAYRLDD